MFLLQKLRVIGSVLEAEAVKHVLLGIILEFHSCNLLKHVLQSYEVQAAVNVTVCRSVNPLAVADPVYKIGGICLSVLLFNNRRVHVCRQTAGMCQKVYDPDIYLLAIFIHIRLEIREIHIDPVYQTDFPLLYQLHETQGCSHALAAGCKVKNGVLRHLLLLRIDCLVAVGLQEDNLVFSYDTNHGTWHQGILDGLFYDVVYSGKSLGRHTHELRGGTLEPGSLSRHKKARENGRCQTE